MDERSAQFYRDRDGITRQAVGSLHAEAGRAPYDRALAGLVGELSMRSQEFRERWAAHDVDYYRSGVQPFPPRIVSTILFASPCNCTFSWSATARANPLQSFAC